MSDLTDKQKGLLGRRRRYICGNRPASTGAAGAAGDVMQRGVIKWVALLGLFVVIVSVVFAWGAPRDRFAVATTAIGISTAAAAVGGLIGWVFGIPRTWDVQPAEDSPERRARRSMHYFANTNLSKVSDWLTTILIGLGLVQLGRLIPAVQNFASAIEEPLGGSPSAGAFGVAIVAVSGVAGCLLAYLWTAVRLRELLEKCEDDASRDETDVLQKETKVLHQHAEALLRDTEALLEHQAAVARQPESGSDRPVGRGPTPPSGQSEAA